MQASFLRCLGWLALLFSGTWRPGMAADKDPSKPPPIVPLTRNRANTVAKTVPTDFEVLAAAQKNVLWKADLGNVSYGGPVVAGGKVFVGTNNERPRDPKVTGDAGVLMCFDAQSGKQRKEPKKVPVGTALKTPALVSKGILYLLTDSTLYAIGKK